MPGRHPVLRRGYSQVFIGPDSRRGNEAGSTCWLMPSRQPARLKTDGTSVRYARTSWRDNALRLWRFWPTAASPGDSGKEADHCTVSGNACVSRGGLPLVREKPGEAAAPGLPTAHDACCVCYRTHFKDSRRTPVPSSGCSLDQRVARPLEPGRLRT